MGIIASFTFFRVDHYSNILCNQPLPGYDNCRSVGEPEGNLYKRVKGEHAAWFSIEWEPYNDNPLQYIFAEATSRTIADVEITGTKPYVGQGRDADIFMQTLVGKPGVALQLGAERGESSMIAERFALLTCHTLEIYPENSSYSAHCFGNGWGGVLEFSPSGEGAVALNQLVDSVNKVRDEEYIGAIIYYAVVWPFFVYIFLIGSLLWWIATKAVRFVKAG